MKTRWAYKEDYSIEQRKLESEVIRKKHPERVPLGRSRLLLNFLYHLGTRNVIGDRDTSVKRTLVFHYDIMKVVVAKSQKSPVPNIDREKFLVPADITVAQFMWVIRKRIRVGSDKAMFLLVDKNLPQSSVTMGELYSNWADEDGFLYVSYSAESTFG